MEVNKEGYVSNLTMKDDPYQMNWMIEDSYLQEKNYKDADKLFGFFELIADKEKFVSQISVPVLKETEKGIEVVYEFETLKVKQFYDLGKDEEALFWSIELENKSRKRMNIKEFGIWISFAYVMFRDKNVLKTPIFLLIDGEWDTKNECHFVSRTCRRLTHGSTPCGRNLPGPYRLQVCGSKRDAMCFASGA